jgi:iron complex outermembrane receptor protein
MLYAKVNRGYKSGGFNSFSIRPSTTTFQPETLTSYEAGLKSDWRLGGVPLRFNATYYYSDYKNIQRSAGDIDLPRAGAAVYAATATIQGFEIESSIRPTEAIAIGATVSHADGDYKQYEVPAPLGGVGCNGVVPAGGSLDLSCSRFQFLTPWIYNINATIDLPLPEDMGEMSLYASYAHVSSQWTAPRPTEPGGALEGYGLLNASLNWRNVGRTGVDLAIFGTNLTNKLYRVSSNNVSSSSFVQSTLYGEPRMFGVKLRYSWGR